MFCFGFPTTHFHLVGPNEALCGDPGAESATTDLTFVDCPDCLGRLETEEEFADLVAYAI